MQACASFSLTVQTLLDSRRTAPNGFSGGGDILVYLTCFDALYARFLVLVLSAESSPRMADIFCVSTPFQIRFVTVGFVAVFVVDFGEIVRIFDKCFGNDFMQSLNVFAEMERGIAVRVEPSLVNSARLVIPDLSVG